MDEKKVNVSKKIAVVTGDGNLNISPVYEHIEIEKPKPKENRTILVPEVKKVKNNGQNSKDLNNSNNTNDSNNSENLNNSETK